MLLEGKILLARIFILVTMTGSNFSLADESTLKKCLTLTEKKDGLKQAHTFPACLQAAKNKNPIAQYAVGSGYAYSGDHETALRFLHQSAENNYIPAFLALGHMYRKEDINQAIVWYERYANTRTSGYGYAAILLAKIYLKQGNSQKYLYWFDVCKKSDYKGCVIH